MTNIQAIDLLKDLEQSLDDYCELNDEGKTAFRMAITALEVFGISEQLPSAQSDVPDTNVGDMISRQATIDAITEYGSGNSVVYMSVGELKRRIEQLPSAQPERKKGKKIVKSNGRMGYWACDKCGETIHPDDNFCPNCGAKMEEDV